MENNRPGTPLTVVTVNGKQYVSGLTWKTLENGRTYMHEAREFGKSHEMDMVAIRRGTVLQAGFAPKSEQRLRGMYSLAAALAGQLGDNWIGVFPLPNEQFAFIAVHDGSVMIGRDLVGDRDLVEMEFNETFNLLLQSSERKWTDTGRIVGPDDWEYTSEHGTLEDLLSPKHLRNEYRLRPLKFGMTRREVALAGGALLIVAAAGVGFLKWQAVQEQTKTASANAAMLQLQQAQEAQEAAAAAALRKNIVRPWEQLPSPAVFIAACDAFWNETPLSVGGWVFLAGQCGPGKAIATFKRPEHGTTVAQFADTVRAQFNQQPAIYEAGTTGTLSASFDISNDKSDTLPATAAQLEGFTAHLQAAGAGTTFSVEDRPWKAPEDRPDAIAPDWTTQGFSIKSNRSPSALLGGLDQQGLRVLEIGVTLSQEDAQLEWSITGELYGR